MIAPTRMLPGGRNDPVRNDRLRPGAIRRGHLGLAPGQEREPTTSSPAAASGRPSSPSRSSPPGSAPRPSWRPPPRSTTRASPARSSIPFAYGLAVIAAGFLYAAVLWRKGVTTFADVFRERFSPGVEKLVVIILLPGSVFWAAAQIRAFGQVLSSSSDLSLSQRHHPGGGAGRLLLGHRRPAGGLGHRLPAGHGRHHRARRADGRRRLGGRRRHAGAQTACRPIT